MEKPNELKTSPFSKELESNCETSYKERCRRWTHGLIGACVLVFTAADASAGVVFRFSDDGTDTTVQVTGSLNLTGLTPTSENRGQALNPGSNYLDAWWGTGSGAISGARYATTGVSSGDVGTVNVSDPAFTPDLSPTFGISAFTDAVIVPTGYSSGDVVNYTGTLTGATLSSLGFLADATQTLTYTVGGGTDFVSFTTVAIPEPSGALSVAALMGMSFLLRSRRS